MAAKDTTGKIRNVGPKSAAWLRQVGVRTQDDLTRLGAVEAFMKVKRAGFRPSLNLLYALEGALADCHWADLPEERKAALLAGAEAAEAANPIKTRWQKQADRSAAQPRAGSGSDERESSSGFLDDAEGGSAHSDSDSANNRFE
ncbi:MAG: TfoX/Sxy family protein [Proteobacteria bacterium]|uniref:TfoX/Sxy family protein n=1 Tax=Rudaea sp. TaxID=2136325 RepID=UPI001E0D4EAB|nr:TfoX/Sxy family protein [Pseudomonadota bacterium]MBS0568199.1 TfoX/Sxy family protein [Pseudomonadota bacterium]